MESEEGEKEETKVNRPAGPPDDDGVCPYQLLSISR